MYTESTTLFEQTSNTSSKELLLLSKVLFTFYLYGYFSLKFWDKFLILKELNVSDIDI